MLIPIEINLDKIDYEGINEHIKNKISEKIDSIDIEKKYNIDRKVECRVNSVVRESVNRMLCKHFGSTLRNDFNSETLDLINDIIVETIKEKVKPIIGECFDAIPDEVYSDVVNKTMPLIFVDMMTEQIGKTLFNVYKTQEKSSLMYCEEVFNNYHNK